MQVGGVQQGGGGRRGGGEEDGGQGGGGPALEAATEEQEDGRHDREEAGGDSGSRALAGDQVEHRRRGTPGRGGRQQQPEVRRGHRDGCSAGFVVPRAVAGGGHGGGRRRRSESGSRSGSRSRSSGTGDRTRIAAVGQAGGVGRNGWIDDGSPPRCRLAQVCRGRPTPGRGRVRGSAVVSTRRTSARRFRSPGGAGPGSGTRRAPPGRRRCAGRASARRRAVRRVARSSRG